MKTAAELRAEAVHLRTLARGISDNATLVAIDELVDELERLADEGPKMEKPRNRSAPGHASVSNGKPDHPRRSPFCSAPPGGSGAAPASLSRDDAKRADGTLHGGTRRPLRLG